MWIRKKEIFLWKFEETGGYCKVSTKKLTNDDQVIILEKVSVFRIGEYLVGSKKKISSSTSHMDLLYMDIKTGFNHLKRVTITIFAFPDNIVFVSKKFR